VALTHNTVAHSCAILRPRPALPDAIADGEAEVGTRSLRFEIALALVLKALALAIIYLAFFSGAHRTVVGPSNTMHALFGSHSTSKK
jgi:hypothetical protein